MRHIIAALLFAAALPAAAGWKESINSSTLYWENDNFGIGRKSDRFYTNGARMTVQLSDPVIVNWRWTKSLRDWTWNHLGGDSTVVPIASVNVIFGQNLYTPQIITIAAPQPLDRPWAGVLYAGISESITDPALRQMHILELNAGVLGQGAGGQATQQFVHNDLGFSNKDPQGWPNQLENEPVLSLRYNQLRRIPIIASGDTDILDIVPEFGGQVGSPQTFLNAGGVLRLGYHIRGLPVALIPGSAVTTAVDRFEFYVFAGGEARFVPFNATLEGGLFRDGPQANGPKQFVRDLRAGVSARYKWLRLTYSVVDRSAEFDVPPGAIENQRFGSVALTIEPFDVFR